MLAGLIVSPIDVLSHVRLINDFKRRGGFSPALCLMVQEFK